MALYGLYLLDTACQPVGRGLPLDFRLASPFVLAALAWAGVPLPPPRAPMLDRCALMAAAAMVRQYFLVLADVSCHGDMKAV